MAFETPVLPQPSVADERVISPGPKHRFGVDRVLRAQRDDWAELLRFCIVGASGYLVNLAVFWLLLERAQAHHIAAAVGAFCVAWVSNFVLNKFWTFRRHALPAVEQGMRYLAISLVGLGINLGLLQLLVLLGVREFPAQAIAIALVTPVNFVLNRRWSFR